MFLRTSLRCTIKLQLVAQSSILVQGAQTSGTRGRFLKTETANAVGQTRQPDSFCIPGSSLKGVWRSAVERILRSFRDDLACDPFAEEGPQVRCSKRLENIHDPQRAYRESCLACQLFGNTEHAGLIQVLDCLASGDLKPEMRTNIAIDRFTGGVQHKERGALFTYCPLPAGTVFDGTIRLDNPEFWQIGLLALGSRDMDNGSVRLGSGTRKGLGHVMVRWTYVELRYAKSAYDAAQRYGDGMLPPVMALNSDDRMRETRAEPWLMPNLTPGASRGWHDSLWTYFTLDNERQINEFKRACVEQAFARRMRSLLTADEEAQDA